MAAEDTLKDSFQQSYMQLIMQDIQMLYQCHSACLCFGILVIGMTDSTGTPQAFHHRCPTLAWLLSCSPSVWLFLAAAAAACVVAS